MFDIIPDSMPLNIIYASDEKYAPLTAVAAASAARHNRGAKVTLLGRGLEEGSVRMVQTAVERFGGSFRHVDVEDRLEAVASTGANPYFSYAAYARIFVPDILAEDSGKALYLDSDTFVLKPLDGLFATDMGESPLALAPDVCPDAYSGYVGLKNGETYYNTGVALFDLANWRRNDCTARFLREIAAPSAPNPLGDQDVIVRIFNGEITPLSPEWNFLSQYTLLSRKEEPSILHFSGNTLGRPWFRGSRHPRRAEYRAFAEELGLLGKVMTSKKVPLAYRIEAALYALLPGFAFRPAFRALHRLHIRLAYGV